MIRTQIEVAKQLYQQDHDMMDLHEREDEDGEDEVSPREVGHNIYILAHQVRSQIMKVLEDSQECYGMFYFMSKSRWHSIRL